MTSTATATFKRKVTYSEKINIDSFSSITYLEYEFYAPEDCCNHIVSTEMIIPFPKVSKRQQKPVIVCYDPKHPTTNAIIKNGKISADPLQVAFILLGVLFIAFSVFLFAAFPA